MKCPTRGRERDHGFALRPSRSRFELDGTMYSAPAVGHCELSTEALFSPFSEKTDEGLPQSFSDALSRLSYGIVIMPVGFEPTTFGLMYSKAAVGLCQKAQRGIAERMLCCHYTTGLATCRDSNPDLHR